MCFAKCAVLSLRVLLSLYRTGLSLSIVTVGLSVLGLYVLMCITLQYIKKDHTIHVFVIQTLFFVFNAK